MLAATFIFTAPNQPWPAVEFAIVVVPVLYLNIVEGLNPRFDSTGVDVNILPSNSKAPAAAVVKFVPDVNSKGALLVVPAINFKSALAEVKFVIQPVVALNEEIGSSN